MDISTVVLVTMIAMVVTLPTAQGDAMRVVKKGENGKALFNGVFRKDSEGAIVSYQIYDDQGSRIKKVIFVYSLKKNPGKCIEARIHGPQGKVEGRIFRTQKGFSILSDDGKILQQYPNGTTDSQGVIDACIACGMVAENIND